VKHGYAADIDATRIKLEDDLYYILNLSFVLDLLILARTIRTVIIGYGAR
jgi:lipopolysaccharide/colanic/teichoic acid biosynthesis glycosyltransferase